MPLALRKMAYKPSPSGKGDEEDRLGEVAASPNSKFETAFGITRKVGLSEMTHTKKI